MTMLIIGALYALFLFSCLLISLFIVIHLTKSSLAKSEGFFMSALFLIVLGSLVFSNIVLFFRIPFDTVMETFLTSGSLGL